MVFSSKFVYATIKVDIPGQPADCSGGRANAPGDRLFFPYQNGGRFCAQPLYQRAAARHNDSLSYEDLLEGVSGLLTENGFFTVVIPADVAERVKKIASIKKLYAVRQLNVITKPGGIPKRVLITFSFSNQECIVEELLTELARHQYSEEYMTLTRDYYLNM